MAESQESPRPWKVGSDFMEGSIIEDATGERILGYPWSGVFPEINDIMERTVRIVNAHDDLVALVQDMLPAVTQWGLDTSTLESQCNYCYVRSTFSFDSGETITHRFDCKGEALATRVRTLLASLEPNTEEENDE